MDPSDFFKQHLEHHVQFMHNATMGFNGNNNVFQHVFFNNGPQQDHGNSFTFTFHSHGGNGNDIPVFGNMPFGIPFNIPFEIPLPPPPPPQHVIEEKEPKTEVEKWMRRSQDEQLKTVNMLLYNTDQPLITKSDVRKFLVMHHPDKISEERKKEIITGANITCDEFRDVIIRIIDICSEMS